MKFFFFILISLLNLQVALAQIFDVEAIKISGNNDKRINLVILSEGYQATELTQFITDAINFKNEIFSQPPFSEYSDYFNVYAIKVPSNESGSDHPGTATLYEPTSPPFPITSVDTYFNTSYDSFGRHDLLYSSNSSIISTVLANNFPEYDQALILVNSNEYGGSGGQFPFSSLGSSANEIAIHELGHSLFDLKDEYYPGDGLAAEAINMTQETNPTLVRWKNWIGINDVDIYPYASSGNAATWNRPHQNCKMRSLGAPFCSVCKEGIIEKIHSLVSPIDTYTPNNNTIDNPTTFPLSFDLDLIHPTNKDLESVWTLNGSNFRNDVDNISIIEADLNVGTNTLTTVVHDNSPFLKVDNHDSFHVYTVTWTINHSSLGIDDIESDTNNFNISLFPNPTNSILNLKFESNTSSDLKVEIISLEGKKVKSSTLSNYENTQIDISNLSQGVYLTNFYSSNVLIASKKLVKN